jgi:toxin ParE1/3/4
MTSSGRFELHPDAARDITEIWAYIAQDNLAAAARVREELLVAMRGLASFPLTGHRRLDLTTRPIRFKRVRDYLVAYTPDRHPVWVIAVLHGRRNPKVMAAILRGRE